MGDLYFLFGNWLIRGAAILFCLHCVIMLVLRDSDLRKTIVDRMKDRRILATGLFALCLIICVFSNRSFYRWVKCDDISTMPEGEYCYYVEVNREFSDSVYTLPAKIVVSHSDSGYRTYHIENVYFDNGGYLQLFDEEFEIDEPFSFNDQNEEYWDCTFTNKRCSDAPFNETKDVSDWDTIRLTFCVVLLLLTYIILYNDVRDAIDKEKALNPAFKVCFYSKDHFYHSTENCPSVRNKDKNEPQWVYTENVHPSQKRHPCSKCCFIVNGEVHSDADKFDIKNDD